MVPSKPCHPINQIYGRFPRSTDLKAARREYAAELRVVARGEGVLIYACTRRNLLPRSIDCTSCEEFPIFFVCLKFIFTQKLHWY